MGEVGEEEGFFSSVDRDRVVLFAKMFWCLGCPFFLILSCRPIVTLYFDASFRVL